VPAGRGGAVTWDRRGTYGPNDGEVEPGIPPRAAAGVSQPDPPTSRLQAAVRRADIVAWLRSPEAREALVRHLQYDGFGFCDGCGHAYPRYAEHLLDALVRAVES
jgi:hypothetical protein